MSSSSEKDSSSTETTSSPPQPEPPRPENATPAPATAPVLAAPSEVVASSAATENAERAAQALDAGSDVGAQAVVTPEPEPPKPAWAALNPSAPVTALPTKAPTWTSRPFDDREAPLTPRQHTALMITRAIVGVGAVAYFIGIMALRLGGALSDLGVDGDQHQSVGQYWRYYTPGAMPPGHLITDYAFAYHAPPIWWVVMATLTHFFEPLSASKIMAIVAYVAIAAMAGILVGRRTDAILGFLTAMVVLRSPDLPEQVTGGMARSLGPFLLYMFLFALIEKRHKLALLSLVLASGIYPSVVIPCGMTYGLVCLVRGPMRDRIRRLASLAAAGVLIILLGKAQDFKSPSWWGPIVTYEQAMSMRAWHAGGRFEEVPHRPFDNMMWGNLVRGHKSLGHTLAAGKAAGFVSAHVAGVLIFTPTILALAAGAFAFLRRRMRGDKPSKIDGGPFPWEPFLLFAGSIASYWFVRYFAFKFFLPSRQLGFTIQYIVLVALPILTWWGTMKLLPGRRYIAVTVATLLSIAPAFVFLGDGLTHARAGYSDHAPDRKTFYAARKLPLDEEIGCDIYYCELMMTLGKHTPYVAKNLAHPLRPGYYAEAERRLVEMNRVLFATNKKTIDDFVQKEHVKYFVYNKINTERLDPRLYHPLKEKVEPIFNAGKKFKRLLKDPPAEAVVFRDGDKYIVDLSKFPDVPEEPVEEAPFIGPMLPPAPAPINLKTLPLRMPGS